MHSRTDPPAGSAFLAGGGEMGALMRAHNWSATSLGPPEIWPQPLRTAIRLLLNTGHPMYVWWGPDLLCFYNDAYRASIGPERHPGSLGRPGREVWDEIWPIIGPQIEQVMSGGGATWHENHLVPITRNGRLEDVYWTYSYGPIDDETAPSGVGGVLVVCTETTQQVLAEQSARAERERLGQMFEQAPGFMAMLEGPEHHFTLVNAAYRRLIGGRDVVGQTIREALPDIQGQGFFELLDRVSATGEPFRGTATAIRLARGADQSMEERVVDFVYQPLTNGDGQVMAVFVEGSDITNAHRAQVALRESEARLRALTDNLPAGMVYQIATGRDGRERRFVYVSQSHEKLTGVPADEVMADPSVAYRLILPEYREMVAQAEATAIRDRQPFDVEVQFRRTDGQVRWARIISAPREQADGSLIWDGIQIDVTDQKDAETKLRELNETLEARVTDAVAERQILADVVESTNASVLVTDMDYRILAINRANVAETKRVWGKRPRVGDSILALVTDMPEVQAQVARNWARALAGEEFMIVEEFGDDANNRVAYEVRFNVLRDREGRQIGAVSTSYDVTDRVRAQAELSETQDALRQAQKMEAVGQLTGGVAHDFNNLLTIIRSATSLLGRSDLPEQRRRVYRDAIVETVDRAAKLTGQLLAFARRQALKPEVFDVSARVHGLADMMRTVMGERVRIRIEASSEPCWVEADVGQFETALVNIAVNARDAMDGEGTLTVRVDCLPGRASGEQKGQPAGPLVAVALTDTGSGIAPEHLAQIFEPFFTTKEVGKGTGLGLSQVYGFAKQSGGDVGVQSEIGQGTTFTLYLPHVQHMNVVDDGEKHEPVPPEPGQGRRVLVVEDNVEVGTFATQLLNDLGYETTWAVDANNALACLEETQGGFDAIFSDVVLPGRSGVELGREIRRRYPKLPIILTSGYSHTLAEEQRHGFELLRKPYTVEDLSRVLTRIAPSRVSD